MLLAVLFVVVTDCIIMEEARRLIERRLPALIAGMTSFGAAMIKTGAAEAAADHIVSAGLPFGVSVALAAVAVRTVILTQPVSNAAAALTIIPVAAADLLGVEPRSLAILVALSASLPCITPLEPACLLVYGPGKHQFTDVTRAGLPLALLSLSLVLLLVAVLWLL